MGALRQYGWTGFWIALQYALNRATVSRILCRAPLSNTRDLEPRSPVQCYEHAAASALLHLEIKKLGCIV